MGTSQNNPYHGGGGGPFPPFQRVMVFIDGENLVCSYQRMVKSGKVSQPNITYKKDTYVWAPASIRIEGLYEIVRSTYYTYTTGPEDSAVMATSSELKVLEFQYHAGSQMPNRLYPVVFWKKKDARNGKGVDIQLTIDALMHTYEGNLDILYLISGDGDFRPMVKEAIRKGKQVYVAALSDGLNEVLKHAADVFVPLDNIYFRNA